ncbi:class I SAM-dependent methyltransferase [Pseudomonas phytophila]|uniref:Class I SAM-dependent methyltransferase n=1 Tax=Pseudomonas phytophila TaxID=2867264 RepID=A0ABY6FAX7_9PSED|nr:class I SAM-dependent methyltransferase [Pseudomonas phytophila]UXZ95011.1 class I SAM-dependent methyltransferase [Pseudomonas phytophila]
MVDRWREYFDSNGAFNPDWLKTAVAHWGFHEVLYGMIQRFSAPSDRILDVGCGPGWSDMYLASLGYSVLGIDNEPSLVDLANQQAKRLGAAAEFQVADAFDLSGVEGQFELAFSCGVLEHFDREVTVRLLEEQAKCAKYVVIQIPTKYTAYSGGITDERIYSINQLAAIVQDAGMDVVSKFGYGDLAATPIHRALRRFLPRAVLRLLQNRGYAYCIAVIGKSRR